MKRIFISICILLLTTTASVFSQTDKMDLILEELRLLRQSVESLDQRVAALESQPVQVIEGSTAVAVRSSDSENLVSQVTDALLQREEAVNFPWMDAGKWQSLAKGMTPEQVLEILGEPSMDDPSLHKRIDRVFTYRGRRPATGERVVGRVRFYRGEVVEIEAPKL